MEVYWFNDILERNLTQEMRNNLSKKRKVQSLRNIELPNTDSIKPIEMEGQKYLGALEINEIIEDEMRALLKTEYFRRLSLMLRSELTG